MMKAISVLSAAAVVLFALPTTGGAAQAAGSAVGAQASVTGVAALLSGGSLFGMTLGAVLWLSIALFAVVVALVFLSRSRGQLAIRGSAESKDEVGTMYSLERDAATAAR